MRARRHPRSNRNSVGTAESRIVPRTRPTLRAGFFMFALGLLLAPWPGWGRLVSTGFSAYANGLAHTLGIGESEEQQFYAPGTGERVGSDDDWVVWLSRRDVPGGAPPRASIDARIFAYTPIAVLLALAFATALPRRRKLVAVALGLSAMLIRLSLVIVLPARAFAEIFWLVLINPPVMSYLTPLLVWWIALTVTTPRPLEGAATPAARQRGRRRFDHRSRAN